MLESLHISNYALIATLDIAFDPALNIITGETGAGKSIIIGALSLILGDRADTRTIRDTSQKTVVEAVFNIEGLDDVQTMLVDADIDTGPQCIVRREITAKGNSRTFVNDTPVTLATLKTIAQKLVDIHSQDQSRQLADPDYQLRVVDAIAGNAALRQRYGEAYAQYRQALKAYADQRQAVTRAREQVEYINFNLQQLDELALKPGEQQRLEDEREVLANATAIKERLFSAIQALNQPTSVTQALTGSASDVAQLTNYLPDARELASRLNSAKIEIQDILETLTVYETRIQADPQRLEDIDQRLNQIYTLEKRHNFDSGDQLIAFQAKLRRQLDDIDNSDDVLAQLENTAKLAKRQAMLIAKDLSDTRRLAAAEFAKNLRERATTLGMPNLRCEIQIDTTKLTADGIDQVAFMVAFNKNQALTPIGDTASGGELSRMALAMRSLVAEKMHLPTLIFDEVDTGVSGDIAVRMAQMMQQISRTAQVIAITHLPQVAAHGNAHFKVFKTDDQTSTITQIKLLNDTQRQAELALMLSGDANEPDALATAKSMLHNFKA